MFQFIDHFLYGYLRFTRTCVHVSNADWKTFKYYIIYLFISHIHVVFIYLRDELVTFQRRQLDVKYFLTSFLDSSQKYSRSRHRFFFSHFLEGSWQTSWSYNYLCYPISFLVSCLEEQSSASAEKLSLRHNLYSTFPDCSMSAGLPDAPSSMLWSSCLGGFFLENWWSM